ncbi:hypothetical protein ACTWPT_07670 [Nonomuraea sp. 3N208]|uniref:hypothetical protein n=1 Tax=Nonomuraea sp. 3N208 TaxID=3457421 RepID=UPI003FCCCB17
METQEDPPDPEEGTAAGAGAAAIRQVELIHKRQYRLLLLGASGRRGKCHGPGGGAERQRRL